MTDHDITTCTHLHEQVQEQVKAAADRLGVTPETVARFAAIDYMAIMRGEAPRR